MYYIFKTDQNWIFISKFGSNGFHYATWRHTIRFIMQFPNCTWFTVAGANARDIFCIIEVFDAYLRMLFSKSNWLRYFIKMYSPLKGYFPWFGESRCFADVSNTRTGTHLLCSAEYILEALVCRGYSMRCNYDDIFHYIGSHISKR